MAARWSAQEDRILRWLYAQKRPVQEIAARVGRSPDAVVARRSSLGIAARPRSRSWSAREEMLLRVATAGERKMLERELAGSPRRRIAAFRRLDYAPGRPVLTTGRVLMIRDEARTTRMDEALPSE